MRAVELDQRIDFDVVHHVTLAARWTRRVSQPSTSRSSGDLSVAASRCRYPCSGSLAGEA